MNIVPKLQMALDRFISRYPLLGGILASWSIRMGGTDTMAVGWDGYDLTLYVSGEFVKRIALDELVGVIHHEARHVIFGHIYMTAEDYPDENALIIAQEVTVNEGIPEPLPGSPILLQDYPRLPPHETTEMRYKRLSSRKRSKKSSSGSGSAQQHQPVATDDHSQWQEIRANESAAKDALRSAIQNALKEAQRRGDSLDRDLQEALEKAIGNTPGSEELLLNAEADPGLLRWQTILRRYLGQELEREFSYQREPRRFPDLLGIVPASVRFPARARILAAIDTSGSMSEKDLNEISTELDNLRRTHEITLVEFDCEIHDVYRLRGKIKCLHGRGGTDFVPLFDSAFLATHPADLVIVFTDGYGPAPERKPRVPVIWILTANGVVPAKWGRHMFLHHSE